MTASIAAVGTTVVPKTGPSSIIIEQVADIRRSVSVQIGIRAPYSFNENFSFLAG
jgi:hypothetical protein